MKVESKRDFYQLYNRGFFGNRVLTWDSLEELRASGYDGLVCVRGIGVRRCGENYDIPLARLGDRLRVLEKEGVPLDKIRFNQGMPNDLLIIQGEVRRSLRYFDLTYTTVKKPMNAALAEEELYTSGLRAVQILRRTLWPASYSDLEDLFNLFPDSVVEFGSYDCEVGDCRGRNTIIWEVRNY